MNDTGYEMRVLQEDITAEEEQELRRLWREAFEEDEDYLEYYHRNHLRQNRIWTLWDGERLISMLHANPKHLWIEGETRNSCFIVGVATEAAYRRQGCMRQLMEDALQTFRQEGLEFVYLLPAKEEYYLPFGFETIGVQHTWRRPLPEGETGGWKNEQESSEVLASLRKLPKGWSDLAQTVRRNEMKHLSEYANKWLKSQATVFVLRDRAYYQKRMEEGEAMGGDLYLLNREARAVGAVMLGREEHEWRIYDVIGDELLQALEESTEWEAVSEQQVIMVRWLGEGTWPQAWNSFVMEELA